MEIRLLGPIEMVADDGTVTPLSGHAAHLLSALVLGDGRTVSTETLIDVLWGDHPPSTARASIQVYVAKLRKMITALAGSNEAELETVAGGYRFTFERSRIDAVAFRALVEETSQLPTALRPRHLTQALALWRGRPYPPWSDDPHFAGASSNLEELRYGAQEDLVAAELALGRHDAQIGPLRLLVDEAPLRERRWTQLMLALYRADRRAEALRTFQQLRSVLGTELGIEPGPAAVALEEAILFDDGNLIFEGGSTGNPRRSVPLPDPGTTFIGRDQEVADIAALMAKHPLVTLTGPGGIGKTRTAIEVARRSSEGVDEVPKFIDLAEITEHDLVVSAVSSALGCSATNSGELVIPEDAHVAPSTVLILDNCEHVLQSVASIIEQIHSACPEVRMIATSREPHGLAFEAVYRIEPLPLPRRGEPMEEIATADAVLLFEDRAKQRVRDFAITDANIAAVTRICRALDGLPLALELAATAIATAEIEDLADDLEKGLAPLEGQRNGSNRRHRTINATIEWSYERLDERSRRLFRRLAVFRDGCSMDSAIAVTDIEGRGPDVVRSSMATLVRRSLVDRHTSDGATRYRLLEPIRHVARDLCRDRMEFESMCGRHGDHFLVAAVNAVAEGDNAGRDRDRWYLYFAIERENCRAAIERAIERADCDFLERIIPGVSRYWFRRNAGYDQQSLVQGAMEVCESSTRKTPSPLLLYGAQMAVAGGCASLADERLASFASGLHHSNEINEQMYWHIKGNVEAFGHGNPAAAVASFSRAAKIGERLGTTRTVMSLSLLAYMRARSADENGVDDCIQRLGRWEQRFPIWYDIAVGQTIGMLALYRGDIDEAERRLRLSLDRIRDAGRIASIIPATIHFGWVLLEVGKIAEATVLTNTALESLEATGGRQNAALLNVKGRIALRTGDTDAAVIAFRQALQLSEIDPIHDTMAWSLVGLGQALAAAGRSSDALRALTIGGAVVQQNDLVLPATEGGRIRSLREDGDTTRRAEIDAWVDDIGLPSAVRSVHLGSR